MESTTEKLDKLSLDKGKKEIKFCKLCTLPEEYCSIAHQIFIKRKDLVLLNNKEEAKEENKEEKKEENKEEKKEEIKDEVKDQVNKDKETKQEPQSNKPEEGKKEEKESKKKKAETPKIIIEESKRGKRKHTTYISNLEKFGINLKDVSKMLSKKCACSATVTKEENGQEVITLTGEFAIEIQEFLLIQFATILKEKDFKIVIAK